MRIIDISHPLSPGTPVWPGDPPVRLERLAEEPAVVSLLCLSTHAGTHIDAPRHRGLNRPGVESIDPAILCGPAVVVAPLSVDAQSGAVISLPEVPAAVERVIIKTGFQPAGYGDGTAIPEYTGISEGVAGELIKAGVRLIGTDAPSVEPRGPAAKGSFAVHDLLLGAATVLVENLRLDGVGQGLYELYCLPLNLVGADGAPARAILIDSGEVG